MNLLNYIFPKPDPLRYALHEAPKGWNPPPEVRAKKRSDNSVFVIDETTRTFGFSDKPFEKALQNLPETLTEADVQELAARELDPYNPGYAAAKAIFAVNPGVTKKELYEAVPGVAKETFKDVLAAFRAAARKG